jgi:hypothetical protein
MIERPGLSRRHAVFLTGAAGLQSALGFAPGARAAGPDFDKVPAALLMVDGPGCPYCRRWNAEVRQGYLNSEEGRFAPLMVRSVGHPDLRAVSGLAYTPTFVAYTQGREIGRIVGYQGADFFWAEIATILRRGGFKSG